MWKFIFALAWLVILCLGVQFFFRETLVAIISLIAGLIYFTLAGFWGRFWRRFQEMRK